MTAHKHAEMIKAKADNIGLVVFVNDDIGGELKWREMVNSFPISPNHEYFLCLPQHKEACLHWLNGLDIEYQDSPTSEWSIIENRGVCSWGFDIVFMQEEFNIRIKPRKEKRWIAYDSLSGNVYGEYKSYEDALDAWSELQLIEIEVEL